jgi:hypothetical protein
MQEDKEVTQEEAAAAGGYNAPGGPPPAAEDNTAAAGTERTTDEPIDSQEDREAAGPFSGTGNQDAMRTAGQRGSTDANHADERTGSDETAVNADSADSADAGKANAEGNDSGEPEAA